MFVQKNADSTMSATPAEIIELAALGAKFRSQQRTGKKPGALFWLVHSCAKRAGHPYTFERLLVELAYSARCREILGKHTEVLDVDRSSEVVAVELPRRGIVDVPFATLRNHLTKAKKLLISEIPDFP